MLPGLNRSAVKRAGRVLLYVYAWHGKGAPVIGKYEGATRAECDAAEAADAAGLAERYAIANGGSSPNTKFVSGLIESYMKSRSWKEGLTQSTRDLWGIYLGEIKNTFGETSTRALQAKGMRSIITEWYYGMQDKPGKADVCLTVFSRVLTWALHEELIDTNPVKYIARIKTDTNRAHMIWTMEDIEKACSHAIEPLQRVFWLAWHSGLRRSDIAGLRWSDVKYSEGHIARSTVKGQKYKRVAYPPLTDGLLATLETFPKIGPLVVTNSHGKPYKNANSMGKTIESVIDRAGLAPLTLHDIRGTYVTRMFAKGTSDEDAEYIMGWAPGRGAKMRAIYGDAHELGKAAAGRLRARGSF